MVCNSLSLSSSSAGLAAYDRLSFASTPFVAVSAPAMSCPLSSPSPLKSLSVTCNLSDKEEAPASSMTKALLTGLVATAAALSVFAADTASPPTAFATMGPGNSGAERTAQKAQDLLKAADKLNVEDAPQRYGPGRVAGSAPQDASKVAQDAGGKALSNIQDGISSIAGNLGGGKENVQSTAEGAVNQAQSKVEDATGNSGPGGIIGSIKDGLQGFKDSVAQKDADAKKILDEATSNVQSTIQ